MKLNNNWVGYLDRSYLQIKNSVLSLLPTYTPEITDHTESNPLVRMLSVWAGIAEMLGYYIDNGAREAHLSTFRLFKSGVKIANSYDYRIKAYIPSSGMVTFYLDAVEASPVTIPKDTKLETEDGIVFYTQEQKIIQAGNINVEVPVAQYEKTPYYTVGTSDGSEQQVFILVDGNVVDNSVIVKINNVGWVIKNTFAFSVGTDKHFVQTADEDRNIIIKFGDDINGKIPTTGMPIEVSYKTSRGTEGNVGSETITKVLPPMSTPTVSVTNNDPSTGGFGVESVELIKRRIPKSIRTLDRAVSLQDFIDVTELHAGVAKAGIEFECSTAIQDYIVPLGGGVANPTLLAEVQEWIDNRKIFTLEVEVRPAGEVHLILNLDLVARNGYDLADVEQKVTDSLVDFLSFKNQNIMGNVYLSDLYEIIETTEGVSHSTIKIMKPVPYASRVPGTNTSLNAEINILKPSSSTDKWRIGMTSSNSFDLYRNNSVAGNYAVGDLITFTDIEITVLSGNYSVGMAWEFYSYPYFGNLNVQGPSLPVSSPSDITIN